MSELYLDIQMARICAWLKSKGFTAHVDGDTGRVVLRRKDKARTLVAEL